ncbi:MAG: hypothetical protein RMI93_00600 [Caldimicrobium sp.]|nr:hypothetical protein [Caldimicrobium sp.]MDW8182093.1 hypothetical protein [Caldimicrobium sp.]
MKKTKRNPFEYFGLTPQFIKECDDETLFKIIRSIYRVLQMRYHPDRGGDPKKAMELNLAYENIDYDKDPQRFQQHKKLYLERLSRKTLRRELENLETSHRKLTYLLEVTKERFWNYITAENFILNKHNILDLAIKVKIFDVISHINYSNIVSFKKKDFYFKEFIFSKGLIYRVSSPTERKLILLRDYKFIGSIKRGSIEPWNLMERDIREEGFFLKNYLTKDTFIKEALFYINPEIKLNTYLFFYNFLEPNRVYLEGVALRVEEVKSAEIPQ